MKKILAFVLILALLFSLAACGKNKPAEEPEQEPEQADVPEPDVPEKPSEETYDTGIPSVGDTVAGFTVKTIREFPIAGATVVLFEHDRTGAQLMYIANNDINRVYDLTFFTRAVDNTGLPHVFEHATLDGSEKYPSKALFFNLSYQTYNTYMNAQTMPLLTTYPVASLSEEQLLKYADYYTDSCLHPMIVEDESIFREEAWRYRLADMDSALTIEGTVYSEMKGADTIQGAAYTNLLRAAFPGSTVGNESGGEPDSIPDMTWESLRSYHEKYYHPSNSMAFLYGQFDDYTAFLKLLDEAFAPFDKRSFSFEDPDYTPISEPVTAEIAYPVEASSATEDKTSIWYAIVCPGLNQDPEQELLLNTLTDILVEYAGPLQQKLGRSFSTGDFATYIELDGPEDAIIFSGDYLNQGDEEQFLQIVQDVLKDVAENGFDQELVDSITASLSLKTKLIVEGTEVGVELIEDIAACYAATGDPFNYLDYAESLEKLADWNREGRYQKAVAEWLVDSSTTALCTVYPEAGLREKLDEAEAARLAEVKAGMSEIELQAIINSSNAEDEEDDSAKYVAQLQAVTVSSLPEEIRHYDVSDRVGEDGVRYIDAKADVDGVSHVAFFLDASGLPQEDIYWLALYLDIVGGLDTSSRTQEELSMLATRYLYGSSYRISLPEDDDAGEVVPRLRAEWTAADEDLATGYDLIYETLFESDFHDTSAVWGQIQYSLSSLKSSITADAYSTMVVRSFGLYSPSYRYFSSVTGLEYYRFLEEVDKRMADDSDGVIAKLESIRDFMHNRTNAAVLCAGSDSGIATNAEAAAAFMARLDARPIERVTYDLPAPAMNEALVIDSTVQYNGIVYSVKECGLEGYTADMDAVSSAIADAYLYPMLRDQYGSYGVMTAFQEDGLCYMVSYRDPNVTETFEVFEALPAFLREMEIDQEELDGYILSAYSYYAQPTGELSGALGAAISALIGDSQEELLDYMREMKALTPEKLKSYADVYAKMVEDGLRFTAGGASAVNANADLYDVIMNPFGAVDATETELDDVPEGHEHYDAVRFVYEYMLMDPLDGTVFGVDETATIGDLAGALYSLLGGAPSDLDEAIPLFQEYGILLANAKAESALTGRTTDNVLALFSEAVEVPYERDRSLGSETLTRGELAEILMSYTLPLLE